MANLVETSTWEEGVYQIEVGDRVSGGVDGVANIQPRQLGNRTKWLKDALAALTSIVNLKAPIANPTFTGTVNGITASMVGLGSVSNLPDNERNVLSASRLTTPVTINGVSFDGSANITVYDSTKEPAFSKNTAFNKNFGTTSGTVCQGNDSRIASLGTMANRNVTISTSDPTSGDGNNGDVWLKYVA